MSAVAGPPPLQIITLIHGTFAREADWIRDGSEFQSALRQRLVRAALFRTFRWSGENSHSARREAGAELAAHLRSLNAEQPGCAHVLIAHSHGGNVACYALEDIDVRKTVRSIVTLGTPFILCNPRRVEDSAKFLTTIFLDCIALLVAMGIGAWASAAVAERYDISFHNDASAIAVFTLLAIALALPALFFFVALMARLPFRFLRWITRLQARIQHGFRMPWLSKVDILSIGVEGDEAGTFLRLLHRLAAIPAYVFGHASRVFTQLGRDFADEPSGPVDALVLALAKLFVYGMFLIIVALPVGLAWSVVWALIVGRGTWAHWSWSWDIWFLLVVSVVGFGVSGLMLLALVSLFAQLLMIVVPPFVRAHRLGFGGESPIENWLADIHIASDPGCVFDGDHCTYREIRATDLRAYGSKASLRHSQLYCASSVIEIIADHINGAAAREATAPGQAFSAMGANKMPRASAVKRISYRPPGDYGGQWPGDRAWRGPYFDIYEDVANHVYRTNYGAVRLVGVEEAEYRLDRLFRPVTWNDVKPDRAFFDAGSQDGQGAPPGGPGSYAAAHVDEIGQRYERWTHRPLDTLARDLRALEFIEDQLRDAVADYCRHREVHSEYLDWYCADTLAYMGIHSTVWDLRLSVYDLSRMQGQKLGTSARVVGALRWLIWCGVKWLLWVAALGAIYQSVPEPAVVAVGGLIGLTAIFQVYRWRARIKAKRLLNEMRTAYDVFRTPKFSWEAAWQELNRTRKLGAVWPSELYALVEQRMD